MSLRLHQRTGLGDGDGARELPRMRHREVDRTRTGAFGPDGDPPAQPHGRLGTSDDLDVEPGEGACHAEAQRLPHGLLARESTGVRLGRVPPRLAVDALGLGEAALAEARIALERSADPVDLVQIDADRQWPSR